MREKMMERLSPLAAKKEAEEKMIEGKESKKGAEIKAEVKAEAKAEQDAASNVPLTPEKKEEKPKPVASAGRPHPYVLHVASFQGPKASLSDVNRWQKRGYTPFVVLTQIPNKGYWYRIYLNRWESLDQATSLALKLKREKLTDSAIPMKLPYALETSESGEGVWQRLKRKSYSPYSLAPGKILVGAYAAKHEAEEASRRLAAEGFPNRIVKP